MSRGEATAPLSLEDELGRQLDDARITRRKHSAEVYRVNVAAWIEKLSVVEDVEEFKPEFQLIEFCINNATI